MTLLIDWLLLGIAVLALRSIYRERREADRELLDKATRLYRGALLR